MQSAAFSLSVVTPLAYRPAGSSRDAAVCLDYRSEAEIEQERSWFKSIVQDLRHPTVASLGVIRDGARISLHAALQSREAAILKAPEVVALRKTELTALFSSSRVACSDGDWKVCFEAEDVARLLSGRVCFVSALREDQERVFEVIPLPDKSEIGAEAPVADEVLIASGDLPGFLVRPVVPAEQNRGFRLELLPEQIRDLLECGATTLQLASGRRLSLIVAGDPQLLLRPGAGLIQQIWSEAAARRIDKLTELECSLSGGGGGAAARDHADQLALRAAIRLGLEWTWRVAVRAPHSPNGRSRANVWARCFKRALAELGLRQPLSTSTAVCLAPVRVPLTDGAAETIANTLAFALRASFTDNVEHWLQATPRLVALIPNPIEPLKVTDFFALRYEREIRTLLLDPSLASKFAHLRHAEPGRVLPAQGPQSSVSAGAADQQNPLISHLNEFRSYYCAEIYKAMPMASRLEALRAAYPRFLGLGTPNWPDSPPYGQSDGYIIVPVKTEAVEGAECLLQAAGAISRSVVRSEPSAA